MMRKLIYTEKIRNFTKLFFNDYLTPKLTKMTEKESALHSQYIIDGVRFEATPADLLEECARFPHTHMREGCDDIVDESIDPPVTTFTYDSARNSEYMDACVKATEKERAFRMLYPDTFTRQRIAFTLLDRLWNEGHYRLGDLAVWARWSWNTRPLGNMAAFYMSAESAGAYLFDLGVKLQDYIFEETDEESRATFFAWLPDKEETAEDEAYDDLQLKSSPYESRHPWISEERKCPDTMVPDAAGRIIYIPFDTCRFSIGGSLLAQVHGRNGGAAPRIQDPDYFIDCYEVVRELAEDGIVTAGVTVGDGGLATAAAKMCGRFGMELNLKGLMSSYQENDITRMLFSEVPGVLLQINDNDFDYLDSQLILQDVAYYPIGIPDGRFTGIRFRNVAEADVADILASLIGQASEGED